MARTPLIAWLWIPLAAACSGASPAPAARPTVATPPADAAVASVDASPPDAGPPAAVLAAPAWVFRYHTAARTETWTLRHADGAALLEVATAQGTTAYVGTAVEDGPTLVLRVATSSAKLALDCKPAQRKVGAACNDAKARPLAVLDCYHPDFAQPMPFGPAPGIEYVVDEHCTGYRLISGL